MINEINEVKDHRIEKKNSVFVKVLAAAEKSARGRSRIFSFIK